ncbi:spore germination protein KA [Salirhabdus euzebyi]|uniref:Spore germination protein KA n=1 Tax=Salirhabdus euzebyi TaxID=394506 RepID=A0A841Q3Y5_9BACI|nr:spore germination protein [Salirhabdus euzebyi]MBB6453104.1 spore germination protein KA [Salirhabdus euzebyi]
MKKKFWDLFGKQKKKKMPALQNIPDKLHAPLHKKVEDNVSTIKETLGNSFDIVSRSFKIGTEKPVSAALFYMEGLADKNFVQDFVLETLMLDVRETDLGQKGSKTTDFYTILKERAVTNGVVKEIKDFQTALDHLLSGDTVIVLEGYAKGLSISSNGMKDRGVQEATSQTVVRGPKEGFTETIRTNTSLIRRRIKDPNLWIETKKVGKKTKTEVAICYLKGVAQDEIIEEVRKRIDDIDIDAILESGYIEELIQDETYTPFPTVYNTERPDTACAGILEGRIVIIVDGTPFVLIVPALFVHFFQSTEDFAQRSDIGTLMRLLRFLCFFIALLTPSAYIALTTFHQEMIPTQLLISLAAQREGVPFPAVVEAFMMEITFEILREAGTRMPRAVGSAISIVGALVLGQAAVEAGIVSSAMVIVVSLTAISSFVSPTFNMSISVRILRFGFMILAGMFGLFGIIIGLIIMVLHLTSLRSFGIPYLAPMGPFIPSEQKDTLVRMPFWRMKTRPKLISQMDMEREETQSPRPPEKEDPKN